MNDGDYIIEEVKDFDKVIDVVLDFVEKDGNILVIVIVDYEIGGMFFLVVEVWM